MGVRGERGGAADLEDAFRVFLALEESQSSSGFVFAGERGFRVRVED